METTTIVAFRHPSQVGLLLEALVTHMGWVSSDARKCTLRSELPASLQRVARAAERIQQHWIVWFHQDVPRLYVAGIATDEARRLGVVALNLAVYNDRGEARHRGLWLQQRDGGWKCREARSNQSPTADSASKAGSIKPAAGRPWYYRN